MNDETLINAIQVAKLAGAKENRHYVFNRLKDDPTFPRSFISQKQKESLWKLSDIEAWLEREAERPRDARGRKIHEPQALKSLDLSLSTQFMIGVFNPVQKKIRQIKRIELARIKAVQTQIVHVEGEWQ